MDPLFGFMDDLPQHHHSEEGGGGSGGGVGEYTISYPTNQSDQYQEQESSQVNPPVGGGDTGPNASSQVVHVVSQDEQNEKKIYVIKLENFLKDEGNPDDTTVKFEAVDQTEVQVEDGSGSEISESSEDEKNMDDQDDEQVGPDPHAVISPESVIGMAQSVGVDLNEDDASELGCLAVNKLRHAILVALQFAHNENSEGITVEHFAKAEEQLGSRGIGHESVFRETAFKYAGRFSVIDDGPEIDLIAAIRQQNISELTVDDTTPILNVHHMIVHGSEDSKGLASQLDDDEYLNTPQAMEEPANPSDLMDTSNPGQDLNESEQDDVAHAVQQLSEAESKPGSHPEPDPLDNLAPEWISYLQVLAELVVGDNYIVKSGCAVDPELKRIWRDIRKNGVNPVFHVVCDLFRDYVKDPTITRNSILNILCVADALVGSNAKPTLAQMTDLGCVLIEILVLPPPCEVHHLLCHVFMEIVKNCNELLTWTCTYITEFLKGISEVPFDQVSDPFKSTMHGALCLANGLEDMSIQIAHEFGWHSSVLTFSQAHSSLYEGHSQSPSTVDSFLEEEILTFYHNFLKNYVNLVPAQDLVRIRERIVTMYGERFNSFSPSTPPTITLANGSNDLIFDRHTRTSHKKAKCIFRKVVYKNKEIVVPLRKVSK